MCIEILSGKPLSKCRQRTRALRRRCRLLHGVQTRHSPYGSGYRLSTSVVPYCDLGVALHKSLQRLREFVKALRKVRHVRWNMETPDIWGTLLGGAPDGWLTGNTSWIVDASGNDATRALDGDAGSFWNPPGPPGISQDWYMVLDLGQPYNLTRLAVNSYGDTTHDVAAFKLQKAQDVATVRYVQGGTNQRQEFGGFQGTARYWKFTIMRTHSIYQPWFGELNLYGTPSLACEYVRTTGDTKLYQWDLPLPKSSPLTFRTNASNDVFIALSLEPSDQVDMYEILIGGRYNVGSVIRRTAEGPNEVNVSTPDNPQWLDVFYTMKGTGQTVYDAWSTIGQVTHYKCPVVDQWESLNIQRVKVVLESSEGNVELIFNGTNTDKFNWFSKSRLLSSPWNDVNTEPQNVFSIEGVPNEKRSFYINRNWGGCLQDAGWLVVADGGPLVQCEWERAPEDQLPYIRFSKTTGYANYNEMCPGGMPATGGVPLGVLTMRSRRLFVSGARRISAECRRGSARGEGDIVTADRMVIYIDTPGNNVLCSCPAGQSLSEDGTRCEGILSADSSRGFWISWAPDGTLAVGREGEGSPFMQWQDPDPLPFQYLGYSTGWGSSGLFRFPCIGNCQEGDGASYRGTVSVTETGKTCQRWDSQTPHEHSVTPADYPSAGLEQNYCRNPDVTPPPEDFGVSTITDTSVTAVWTPTSSPIAIGYRVWIRESGQPGDLSSHYLAISQTEVTFQDLVPATEYIISATTINMYVEGPEESVTAVTGTVTP
ncbi:hypothetical protein Bbelb_441960, partial [Branchiostoma belcheri]